MNLLAFAATSSKHSINKQILGYATRLIEGGLVAGTSVKTIDLNDYEMPIYSIDREKDGGIPQEAQAFFDEIGRADGVLISFAEHNGSYTAAYKNIFDWASRIEMPVYQNKPTVMLSTSPGKRGGGNVLKAAIASAPHFGNDLKGSLAIPSFQSNFDPDAGSILNAEIDAQFRDVLASFFLEGTS
jgi:chromate reductase